MFTPFAPAAKWVRYQSVARNAAMENNETVILNNLIERGVRVVQWSMDAMHAWKDTLELLLAQGWDINSRADPAIDNEPFATAIWSSGAWSTARASIHGIKGHFAPTLLQSMREVQQISRRVAACGSVATFELFQWEVQRLHDKL